MKKIKILFLIHDLSVGGAEKVLVNLVNNMDSNKFDITVMALFGGGVNEQFLKPHIKIINCFKKPFPGNSKIMKLLSPERLHKWLIKDVYDIEVSYLEGPSARIISGCQRKETKRVCWIHVEQHDMETADQAFCSHREAENCYQKFDKIICVSEYVKKDFLSIYHLNNPVEVLYNTNETEQILEQSKEPVDLDCNAIKLVGVGKVLKNKGFDRLARIHKRLREEGFPIHTYILGIGDQQNEIVRFLKENHLEDSFTFLGYQTNPYKYVAKCDIFVCSSFAEGFSTAATEALIVGTPVVTTLVSGMEEMLGSNNEYGIIVKNEEEALYQGIKLLVKDKKLRDDYAKRAKVRGSYFTTANTVNAVEKMFFEIKG